MRNKKSEIAPVEPTAAKKISNAKGKGDSEFIVPLGKVESLTLGGGKAFEDNGASYQRDA
jgi:hypothetical protein